MRDLARQRPQNSMLIAAHSCDHGEFRDAGRLEPFHDAQRTIVLMLPGSATDSRELASCRVHFL